MDGMRADVDDRGNANTKSCQFLEFLAVAITFFLSFALCTLHWNFVGSAGCLPDVLSLVDFNATSSFNVSQHDQVLYISIDREFVSQSRVVDSDSSDAGMLLRGSAQGLARMRTVVSPESLLIAQSNTSSATRRPKEPQYDYKFAYNSALLMLPYSELVEHNFKTVNVSLGRQCFGGSLMRSLIPLGGVDTVIVNDLMHTFRSAGHVLTRDGDYFQWSSFDLKHYSNFSEWVSFKTSVLLYSAGAFFLLSTITALLVRVLISSGIVLVFPIFWLLEYLGYHGINLRIISISYPWIGLPLEVIRSRNQSTVPFIVGHLSRVVVFYFLYQFTQLVFALFFYNRDSPGQQELWIFGVIMIWEYYSMIYVRAKASIQLFPRASLALFLLYHFYYFSFPGGFHTLALSVVFFALASLMVHCLRVYELQAYSQGLVSIEQPRMLYNGLPWPSWRADLPPDFTLMMPVTLRSESAYQTSVPAIHRDAGAPPPPGQAEAGIGADINTQSAGMGRSGRPAGGATRNPLFVSGSGEGGSTAAGSSSSAGIELRSVPFSSIHERLPDSGVGRPAVGRTIYTRLSAEASDTGSAGGSGSSHGLLADVDLDSSTSNSNSR